MAHGLITGFQRQLGYLWWSGFRAGELALCQLEGQRFNKKIAPAGCGKKDFRSLSLSYLSQRED
jgi:hypothetical protein